MSASKLDFTDTYKVDCRAPTHSFRAWSYDVRITKSDFFFGRWYLLLEEWWGVGQQLLCCFCTKSCAPECHPVEWSEEAQLVIDCILLCWSPASTIICYAYTCIYSLPSDDFYEYDTVRSGRSSLLQRQAHSRKWGSSSKHTHACVDKSEWKDEGRREEKPTPFNAIVLINEPNTEHHTYINSMQIHGNYLWFTQFR